MVCHAKVIPENLLHEAFRREVWVKMGSLSEKLKKIGLETSKCYQCGTCSGDCPVAKIDFSFNPRKIVLETSKDAWIDSNLLWKCATCYKCYRCPRDVKPAEVFSVARKILVKEGDRPKVGESFARIIKKYGELSELKLVFDVKGFKSINMTPPTVIWRMFRKGKINIRANKSPSADEVKRIFEIVGGSNGR